MGDLTSNVIQKQVKLNLRNNRVELPNERELVIKYARPILAANPKLKSAADKILAAVETYESGIDGLHTAPQQFEEILRRALETALPEDGEAIIHALKVTGHLDEIRNVWYKENQRKIADKVFNKDTVAQVNNARGQTNVPAGLSNAIAIGAGAIDVVKDCLRIK